jgi:hypothetical protein
LYKGKSTVVGRQSQHSLYSKRLATKDTYRGPSMPSRSGVWAPVTLLLSDGYETCEWDAIVGFSATPMRWTLLGHAGFLEFFDVQLLGSRRETIIVPNTAFAGQHFTVPTPSP